VLLLERHALPLAVLELSLLHDRAQLDATEALALRFSVALTRGGDLQQDQELDGLGAALSAGSDGLRSWLRLELPADRLQQGLELLERLALRPGFPRAELRRLRKQWQRKQAQAARSAGRVLRRAEQLAVYGPGHPLGELATVRDYRRLRRRDLQRMWEQALDQDSALLVVAGDFDARQVLPQLEARFGALGGGAAQGNLAAPPVPGEPQVLLADYPGSGQARIVVSLPAPAPEDPDAPLAALVSQALGGHYTARLNTRLRLQQGLAYGASSALVSWPGHSRLRISTRVGAQQLGAAVRGLRQELQHCASQDAEAFDADELARSRAILLVEQARKLERSSTAMAQLGRLAALGQDEGHWQDWLARIEAADADELRRVAARICQPQAATWVLVGDRELLEPQLEEVGLFPTAIRSAQRVVEGP